MTQHFSKVGSAAQNNTLLKVHRASHNIKILKQDIRDFFKQKRSSLLVMKSIDLQVIEIVSKVSGCWCAGGAPLAMYTGTVNQIRDWDLFFMGHESMEKVRTLLERSDFKLAVTTKYALTFEKSGVFVQLIHGQFFPSIEDVFSVFDFSASCIAIDGTDFFYENQTLKSISNKTLEFYGTSNMQHVLIRLAKYGAKGFKPSQNFGEAFYDFIENNIHDIDYEHTPICVKGSYVS